MIKGFRVFVVSATVAVTLAATTTSGNAASWWPWSKKKEAPVQEVLPEPMPTPPAAVGPDGMTVLSPDPILAPDPIDRVARLEEQVRQLTGQVEMLNHQVQLLQQQLQAGVAPRKQAKTAKAAEPEETAVLVAPAEPPPPPDAIGNVAVAGEGGADLVAPAQPLGTLTLDQPGSLPSEQPMDLSPRGGVTAGAEGSAQPVRVVGGPTAETEMMASLGEEGTDYESAYKNILSGDYDRAENSFRAFLAANPADERAPDAQYWIGESLFERGKYREAANEFLNGHKAYPKSGKSPDTLLKLGLSLAGLGERDAACSTYAQVLKQYPEASNALRSRVKAEQASAAC